MRHKLHPVAMPLLKPHGQSIPQRLPLSPWHARIASNNTGHAEDAAITAINPDKYPAHEATATLLARNTSEPLLCGERPRGAAFPIMRGFPRAKIHD